MQRKQASSDLEALVLEVLHLCGEVDAPIPEVGRAGYLGAETVYQFYVRHAMQDPQDAYEYFSRLKKELSFESGHR